MWWVLVAIGAAQIPLNVSILGRSNLLLPIMNQINQGLEKEKKESGNEFRVLAPEEPALGYLSYLRGHIMFEDALVFVFPLSDYSAFQKIKNVITNLEQIKCRKPVILVALGAEPYSSVPPDEVEGLLKQGVSGYIVSKITSDDLGAKILKMVTKIISAEDEARQLIFKLVRKSFPDWVESDQQRLMLKMREFVKNPQAQIVALYKGRRDKVVNKLLAKSEPFRTLVFSLAMNARKYPRRASARKRKAFFDRFSAFRINSAFKKATKLLEERKLQFDVSKYYEMQRSCEFELMSKDEKETEVERMLGKIKQGLTNAGGLKLAEILAQVKKDTDEGLNGLNSMQKNVEKWFGDWERMRKDVEGMDMKGVGDLCPSKLDEKYEVGYAWGQKISGILSRVEEELLPSVSNVPDNLRMAYAAIGEMQRGLSEVLGEIPRMAEQSQSAVENMGEIAEYVKEKLKIMDPKPEDVRTGLEKMLETKGRVESALKGMAEITGGAQAAIEKMKTVNNVLVLEILSVREWRMVALEISVILEFASARRCGLVQGRKLVALLLRGILSCKSRA